MPMRALVVSLLALLTATGCAEIATSPTEAPAAGATIAPSSATPGATQSNSALDLPIEKVAVSAYGCTILDRDFPGLRAHPMYEYFKSMSLNQIAAMSHGKITPGMLAQAQTDLGTLNIANTTQVNTAAIVTPTATPLVH
jgi:uncharacterized protein YceK